MPDFHGYGIYIWPAYGIAIAILAGLVSTSVWRNVSLKRRESDSK